MTLLKIQLNIFFEAIETLTLTKYNLCENVCVYVYSAIFLHIQVTIHKCRGIKTSLASFYLSQHASHIHIEDRNFKMLFHNT